MSSNQKPNGFPSDQHEFQRRWPNVETALNDPQFVDVLTNRCVRFGGDPDDVVGSTLEILCRPAVMERYDPRLGSVVVFALGVAWRVASRLRKRECRQQAGVPFALGTGDDSILRLVIAREHLSLVLAEIGKWPQKDQELIWRAAGFRYSRDLPPLTGTQRARLHRLRRKLMRLIG